VLNPHTGEILALANAPTFDPNSIATATADSRRNGALQNTYEPGSTFKIVAYSAAIEQGLASPDDKIDCQMGSIRIGKTLIHDHMPFGVLTVAEALAKSSNVGAIKLALKVGDKSMYDFIQRFGFGSRTGVELAGETRGILRPVERWQPASIGYLAMGQEVGVTPLQMAAAFGAVANGGVRVAPHLVREVRAAGANGSEPTVSEQRRVISAETANKLKGMLEGVTLKGTAKKAQLDGYTAAGKTGTAQKAEKNGGYSKTKYIASFVGFAPVENPAVVIIVVIDEPTGSHHGGDVAAPVFREIAEQILPDLGVAPDTQLKPGQQNSQQLVAEATQTPASNPSPAQTRVAQGTPESRATSAVTQDGRNGEIIYAVASKDAVLMPDLRGRSVRDVARTCLQLGLQCEVHGDGRVVRQSAAPGTEVANKQLIQVEFGRVQ
jgi:cell division protein FtsI/penicillin-binding protein 2